jgi:hypothetical protein
MSDLSTLNGLALIEPPDRDRWQQLLDQHGLPLVSAACTDAGTPATLIRVRSRLPLEHPPTDQVHHHRRALRAKTTQAPETTMPDALLTELTKALADRGRGAAKALAAELGIDGSSMAYWRQSGKIPDARRDGVRKWIDTPTITAIRVMTTPRAQARARMSPAAKAQAGSDPVEIPPTDPAHIKTITSLAAALGIPLYDVWKRDGDTMRKVLALVLS